MEGFRKLFTRFKNSKAAGTKIDWEKIKPPSENMVVPLDLLPDCSLDDERQLAKKLCVLKLNGGLGIFFFFIYFCFLVALRLHYVSTDEIDIVKTVKSRNPIFPKLKT